MPHPCAEDEFWEERLVAVGERRWLHGKMKRRRKRVNLGKLPHPSALVGRV